MPFLMEVTGRHRVTKALRVFRFTDVAGGYRTAPGDDPANVYFDPFITQPGNYRRNLFGTGGRTTGASEVDRGTAEIMNMSGELDRMRDYAFDGYDLTISAVKDGRTRFSDRVPYMRGTMEQIGFDWDAVKLYLRSRLALLDKPLQPLTYAGTTTDATKVEAEGGEDLKGAPRVLLYGAPLNVPAVALNRFSQIYGVGHQLSAVLQVRDKGAVVDAAGADYPTLAALRSATISEGRWASCLALGLIRFGGNVVRSGQVTVNAVEGGGAAMRTAGQVVRRILIGTGLVEGVDFLASDIAALDAEAPYEVGYWPGTNRVTTLNAVTLILASVGASIAPDRLGLFRIVRFRAPSGQPARVFRRSDLVEDDGPGLQRQPTGDDGRGVPAKNIIVRHSLNHAVVTRDSLSGTALQTDPTFVAFVTEEWRQENQASADIAEIHKNAPEMTFDTMLVTVAGAKAMAAWWAGLYSTYRDRLTVKVRPSRAAGVDLSSVVALDVGRFGLVAARPLVVAGILENLEENMTTLDVWG
ncbi:hypothetical protein [Aureimonas ureilytica]|uniref:hypothetical protein n=1 Tax=Aureimonas ureilytica TaxID=401562 RepID=UPI00036BCB6F|nr:hypothetical protein [Aureimonas ureilytica]